MLLHIDFLRRNRTISPIPVKSSSSSKQIVKGKVSFADGEAQRHEYEFDPEDPDSVWYSRSELKAMNETRFDDAATLRQSREQTSDSAATSGLGKSSRSIFISSKITHALDDIDDDNEISIRGIEHFVYPDLQEEMIKRKKELKRIVLEFSRSKKADPQGWRLAKESASHSKWARDVATERGLKYCQHKRGGLLFKNTRRIGASRRLFG